MPRAVAVSTQSLAAVQMTPPLPGVLTLRGVAVSPQRMGAALTSSPPPLDLTWRDVPVTLTSTDVVLMERALPGVQVRRVAPARTGSMDAVQTEEHQPLALTLKAVAVPPACLDAVLMATLQRMETTLTGARTRICLCLLLMSVDWRRTGDLSGTLWSDGLLTWSMAAVPGSGMGVQAETEITLTPRKNAMRSALIPSAKM